MKKILDTLCKFKKILIKKINSNRTYTKSEIEKLFDETITRVMEEESFDEIIDENFKDDSAI